MRRYRGPFRLSDAFCRHQFLADCTINMLGSDFRQGHPDNAMRPPPIGPAPPYILSHHRQPPRTAPHRPAPPTRVTPSKICALRSERACAVALRVTHIFAMSPRPLGAPARYPPRRSGILIDRGRWRGSLRRCCARPPIGASLATMTAGPLIARLALAGRAPAPRAVARG
jgi:hypothetical protein